MDPLEKIVLIEMSNKQFGKMNQQEYYDSYRLLNQEQKERFYKIVKQIHDIFNHINTESILNVHNKIANSIIEYHENLEMIDPLILSIHKEFGLTLKREVTKEIKDSIIRVLGEEFYNKNYEL